MTEVGEIPRLRYDEGCLAAHALNAIGDRWALLVVRELMFRPKRFQTIRAGLPGITAGVLARRLTELAAADVVEHDPGLGSYALTDPGRALMPVLVALCHWGRLRPGHDPRRFISPTALVISMTATLDPGPRPSVVAGMAAGLETFTLRTAGGALTVAAGLAADRRFTLAGDGNALARAVYGPRPLADLVAEGRLGLDGDASAAQAFVDRFSLRRVG